MRQKIKNLRLEVVGAKGYMSTTSIAMPEELPSVEEALKLLLPSQDSAVQSLVFLWGRKHVERKAMEC